MENDKTRKSLKLFRTLDMLILKTREESGADARLQHCTVPPADHQRRAPGRGRIALSGLQRLAIKGWVNNRLARH
jgi:hypothetical protein